MPGQRSSFVITFIKTVASLMPGQLSLRFGTSKANLGTKEAGQQAAVLYEEGSQFPLTITSITVL